MGISGGVCGTGFINLAYEVEENITNPFEVEWPKPTWNGYGQSVLLWTGFVDREFAWENEKLIVKTQVQWNQFAQGLYELGGAVGLASDQLDSTPYPTRRGTYLQMVFPVMPGAEDREAVRTGSLKTLLGDDNENWLAEYPGGQDVNHAMLPAEMGPGKTGWEKVCKGNLLDTDFLLGLIGAAGTDEECYPIQLGIWGYSLYKELNATKFALDEDNLFQCQSCVGSAEDF